MSRRSSLLSSTVLSSVSGVFFTTLMVQAAGAGSAYDFFDRAAFANTAPSLPGPAVDGINGKVDAFGGTYAHKTLYGTQGAVSIPLQGHYGAQIEGTVGSYDGKTIGAVAGHLFWRDPTKALLGLYVSHSRWDVFDGVHANHVAVEGEYYVGRWTLQGVVGAEFGNSTTGTVGGFIQTYDVKTRFFDQINLAYYLTDNLKTLIGHRYLGGKHQLALGGEWGFPVNARFMGALFVEGRVGESDSSGVWGGVKLYVGQKDKSLIRRHREDDPILWSPNTLFGIINSFSQTPVPPSGGGGGGDGEV